VNALLLGFASRLYTSARGITNEDAMVRFYRRHLSLEVFAAIGALLILGGLAIDVVLLIATSDEDYDINIAAIAQTMIVVGANTVLAGFMASLVDDRRR
jgi:hypothetical protein